MSGRYCHHCRRINFLFIHTGTFSSRPNVDDISAFDPFLPNNAESLLESGEFFKVPVLWGTNSGEGILNAPDYIKRWKGDLYNAISHAHNSMRDRIVENLKLCSRYRHIFSLNWIVLFQSRKFERGVHWREALGWDTWPFLHFWPRNETEWLRNCLSRCLISKRLFSRFLRHKNFSNIVTLVKVPLRHHTEGHWDIKTCERILLWWGDHWGRPQAVHKPQLRCPVLVRDGQTHQLPVSACASLPLHPLLSRHVQLHH